MTTTAGRTCIICIIFLTTKPPGRGQNYDRSRNSEPGSMTLKFNMDISGQMEEYFTNLDFPEIAGDYPY